MYIYVIDLYNKYIYRYVIVYIIKCVVDSMIFLNYIMYF